MCIICSGHTLPENCVTATAPVTTVAGYGTTIEFPEPGPVTSENSFYTPTPAANGSPVQSVQGTTAYGNGTGVTTITYNLYEFVSTDAWTPTQVAQMEAALAIWETVANVDFVRTYSPLIADVDMYFGVADGDWFQTNIGSSNILGFMSGPATSQANGYASGVMNTSFWNDSNGGSGGYFFRTLMHEIGHGLGLGHTHDTGFSSVVMDGVTSPFGDYGTANLNQGINTIMSYNRGWTDKYGNPSTSDTFGLHWGLGALDIAAVQAMYGANTNYASGNNTYNLFASNSAGTGFGAIWDSGGLDTISYGGATQAVINLTAATLDYTSTGGGPVSYVQGVKGGYTIANGVVIENASGGSAGDVITGNSSNNTLSGNGGNDTINGNAGIDVIYGGTGSDSLYGGEALDVIFGGNGLDSIYGGDGGDSLHGDGGVDFLFGGDSVDFVYGGSSTDSLFGGLGDDSLFGGDGADVLTDTQGNNFMDGGTGNDSITGGGYIDRILGGLGADTILAGGGNDTAYGGTGRDLIYGQAGDNFLSGDGDNDTIYGSDNIDRILGGQGADSIYGGSNIDTMYGGSGGDSLYGGVGADTVFGGHGDDEIFGSSGNNLLVADDGNDLIVGGDNSDRILSGRGNDTAFGGSSNDTIYGGSGADTLYGGAGVDTYFGDSGQDQIVISQSAFGGVATGGDGADTLVLSGVSQGATFGFGYAGGVYLVSLGPVTTMVQGLNMELVKFGNGTTTSWVNALAPRMTLIEDAGTATLYEGAGYLGFIDGVVAYSVNIGGTALNMASFPGWTAVSLEEDGSGYDLVLRRPDTSLITWNLDYKGTLVSTSDLAAPDLADDPVVTSATQVDPVDAGRPGDPVVTSVTQVDPVDAGAPGDPVAGVDASLLIDPVSDDDDTIDPMAGVGSNQIDPLAALTQEDSFLF